MARLRFIRDIWWLNSGVTDDTGASSTASYNICNKLNDASGALRFNGNTSSFFTRTIETDVKPEKIRIVCDRSYAGGSQIQLIIKVNDVIVYDETFTSIGANPRTETTTLTAEEIVEVTKNRHSLHYNVVEIEAIYDSPGANLLINNVELHYESDTSATYNNHKSLGTSNTKYIYPKKHSFPISQYQGDWKNSSGGSGNIEQYIQGPTSSSSTESTYIVSSGEPAWFNYGSWSGPIYSNLEFAINDSGYYIKPTQIERAFLNLRYNQSGNQINAQSDSFNVTVYSNKVDDGEIPYMWGPGFGIEPSSSGYLVGTTPLYYIRGSGSDIYYNTSSLIRDSIFKFTGLPSGLKIAAAEVLYYTEPDDILLMHTCCDVGFKSNSQYPYITQTGKNRFKSVNTNNFFDVGFWQLNPSSIISNTSLSGTLLNQPLFWHNYYHQQISAYANHNHCYYNSMFLDENNQITLSGINLDEDFTIYLQLSSSGSTNHSISNNGNILTKYGPTNNVQLEIFAENSDIHLRVFDSFGDDQGRFCNSSSNNQIIITNELLMGTNNLKLYFSDGNEDFLEQDFPIEINKAVGAGNIILCSGIYAYLHEFGFASQAINITEFNKTRHNYAEYLMGSGVVLNVPSMSGSMVENFSMNFSGSILSPNFYQYHTPMIFSYDTYLTNPSSIRFTINYENATNAINGLNFSGYYLNGYNESNNELFVRFNKNLPSGNATVTFGPSEWENRYVYQSSILFQNGLNLNLNQELNNHQTNFKLKSFIVSYDGWYLPATGVNMFPMYTIGVDRPSNNLDFYLQNQLATSGIDFYIAGKEFSNNFVNFHTISTVLSSGYFDFTTSGKYIATDSINLYLSGLTPPMDSKSLDMVINGLMIGDYDVYNEVYNPPYFPLYFYSGGTTQGGMFGTFNMYIGSVVDPLSSINMFIGSSMEETEDSINLFVDGSITEDKHIDMFLHNTHSGDFYDFTMFMQVPQSGSTSDINMYTISS